MTISRFSGAGSITFDILPVGCRRQSHKRGARKPAKYKFKLTAVAFANKVPRIVFALMTHGGEYVERPVVA
jgi:hypothetical protein